MRITYSRELGDIDKTIIEEAKPLVKEYFDYTIPIATIEDAGITSTGSISKGNQLPILQEEYYSYRKSHSLWEDASPRIEYQLTNSDTIVRKYNNVEVILNAEN